MNRKDREIRLHKRLAEGYENIREKNTNGRYYSLKWFEEMLSMLPKVHGNLLDIGCGTGILYDALPKGIDYTGIDLSKDMVAVGKKRYPLATFKVMDCENLEFKDETFDIIIVRGVIHHIPEPKKALAEISRCMKKGGIIVISEPKHNALIEIARDIIKKVTTHFDKEHTSFREKEIINIIESAKLTLIQKRYFGYLAYPVSLPDIIPLVKIVPHWLFLALFKFDKLISHLPLLKKSSWQLIITARK